LLCGLNHLGALGDFDGALINDQFRHAGLSILLCTPAIP
jgi:hypothetical protein